MTLLQRFWHWLLSLFASDRPPTYRRETDGLPMTDGRRQDDARREDSAAGPPPAAVTSLPPPGAGAAPAVDAQPPVSALVPPNFDLPISDDALFSVCASILTRREAVTYRTLLRAVGGRFQVMAKVRLGDFIHLDNDPAQARDYRTRLFCRHVDFLLCEPYTLRPRLAIELDDHSHNSVKGQADDRFKDDLFAAAGLPLLRLDKPNYTARMLRERVDGLVGGDADAPHGHSEALEDD